MKKIKLLTLAFAALFAGNAMAAETVFQWGDMTQSSQPTASIGTLETTFSYASIKIQKNKTTVYGIKADGSMINSGKATKYVKIAATNGFLAGDTVIYSHAYNNSGEKTTTIVIANPQSEVVFRGTQTNNTRNVDNPTIDTCILASDADFLYLGREGSTSTFVLSIKVIRPDQPKDLATLKSITVGGEALEGFSAETETYNVELPYGTVDVPVVAAVATSAKANVVVTPAASLPGATTIVVTAEDGTTTKTYTINFTVAQTQSDDATLSAITVDGKAIAGFKADSMNYAYEVAYNYAADKFPVVAATANDGAATIAYTQITEIPGTATIVVTAQAGNTLTYTIAFTKAAAPKILAEVLFSNGVKGASINGVVRVPYLEGTDVPAIVSVTAAADGTAAVSADGTKITVTGVDNTTLDYTIEYVALAPVSLGTEVVTFDSTETYIFDPYGWDASKGWKFAKSVEDAGNRRISEGRTRIYMALPAAKEVLLTSGAGGVRAIKVLVNGVENTEITSTADKGATMTIALDSKNNNFVAIESNQTKGDGGFTALQLVPAGESAIDNAVVTETVQKMLINGQLVIIKNGVRYNAQGMQL